MFFFIRYSLKIKRLAGRKGAAVKNVKAQRTVTDAQNIGCLPVHLTGGYGHIDIRPPQNAAGMGRDVGGSQLYKRDAGRL